jgi:succinoglycan biosynthesis protein ExoH
VLSARIDALRLFAILMTVTFHLQPNPSSPLSRGLGDGWLLTKLYLDSFLMPSGLMLFTTLTAYLNLSRATPKPYLTLVRQWARRLLIPLAAFTLPPVLVVLALQAQGRFEGFHGHQLWPWDTFAVLDAALGLTKRPINVPLYFLKDVFLLLLLSPAIAWLTRRTGPLLLLALLAVDCAGVPAPIFHVWTLPTGFALGAFIEQRRDLLAAVDRHGPALLLWALAVASGLVFAVYLGAGPTRFTPPPWLEAVNRLAGAPACWWLTRFMVRGRLAGPVRWLQAYSFPIFTMHAMLMAVLWTAYNATHQPPGSAVFWTYWLVTAPFGAAAPVLIALAAERVAPRPWAFLLGLSPPAPR